MELSDARTGSEASPCVPDLPGDSVVLPGPGDPGRWPRLQALRRGLLPPEPWLAALETGALAPEGDLLAALWARLERPAVERLLAGAPGLDPRALLEAIRAELPERCGDSGVRQAWLDPLLQRITSDPGPPEPAWLELIGHFHDQRVADLLRKAIVAARPAVPELAPLLPLLGCQRCSCDGPLLLELALQPAPRPWRRAALEGLAVGLSAWPPGCLEAGLQRLAGDLDATLAAVAVDLLARLPHGQRQLRGLQHRSLDPEVAARLRRRLQRSPMLLVVHGRQGGEVPGVLLALARDLERRRGAPVLLQALTGAATEALPQLRPLAERAGMLTVVPLLLLPGEHVRRDLPVLAAEWRARLEETVRGPFPGSPAAAVVRRLPFLGAWPSWQRLLRDQLDVVAGDRELLWLHHPLEGPLGQRFLHHLSQALGRPGAAVPFQNTPELLGALTAKAPILAPLSLAPSRLSEALNGTPPANMEQPAASVEVLPPLLDLPAVRAFLLSSLESLP